MSDFLVTVADLRRLGYCAKGQRRWIINWSLDVKEHFATGTMSSVLLATGDGHAKRAIEQLGAMRDG